MRKASGSYYTENAYSRPGGQSLLEATVLRSRGFKTTCNDLSLRKTGDWFMAICASGENLLQEATGIRCGRV